MAEVLQLLLLGLISFAFVNGRPARDILKFPCHEYLDIISEWPDGFRGMLELPVKQKMWSFANLFKDGHVIIRFNKSINTLDVPEEDHGLRKVSSDGMEYRIFIKFLNKLKFLKEGDVFSLDISVHHQRWMKGKIGIVAIKFGNFVCPEPVDAVPNYPSCDAYIRMIDNTPPDGFRAEFMIPVNYTMNGWNMEVGFTKEILVLDAPQGIRMPSVRNVKVFSIENRDYNGFIKKNSIFCLEFMVHFDRHRFKKRYVKVNYIRFGLFQCRLPSFTNSHEDGKAF